MKEFLLINEDNDMIIKADTLQEAFYKYYAWVECDNETVKKVIFALTTIKELCEIMDVLTNRCILVFMEINDNENIYVSKENISDII